jgi:hypothetical protein
MSNLDALMSITKLDLEGEITKSLADEFRKSVDFEMMCDIMVEFRGYVIVEIEYGPDKKWIDIMAWFDANCTGDYKEHNGKWLIERPEDATMFKLKWL